jgi:dihydrofolate reductase
MAPMEGMIVCPDFCSAVERACQGGGKVFFIGGREIYKQALPLAGRLSVSWIKKDYAGDCRFPPYRQSDWLIEQEWDYPEIRHIIYQRK